MSVYIDNSMGIDCDFFDIFISIGKDEIKKLNILSSIDGVSWTKFNFNSVSNGWTNQLKLLKLLELLELASS